MCPINLSIASQAKGIPMHIFEYWGFQPHKVYIRNPYVIIRKFQACVWAKDRTPKYFYLVSLMCIYTLDIFLTAVRYIADSSNSITSSNIRSIIPYSLMYRTLIIPYRNGI